MITIVLRSIDEVQHFILFLCYIKCLQDFFLCMYNV